MDSRTLRGLYQTAHDRMRDVDGLLPQEALDELLKFLFYKDHLAKDTTPTAQCALPPHRHAPDAIRLALSTSLVSDAPWACKLWPGGTFGISDPTLLYLRDIFADVHLKDLSIDIRSTALWTFITPEMRKGLGIFTTPEDVVRTMIEVVAPEPSDTILDPACGTATFLLETFRFINRTQPCSKPLNLYGVDKNPRMLLLAALNFGPTPEAGFRKACADSLKDLGHPKSACAMLEPDSVDVILTNPPFGVTVPGDTGILDLFGTGRAALRHSSNRAPSEILFVELCLRLLKPNGRLGIVLPRSVITNERFASYRRSIDGYGYITDIVELPPETFASTGTQTTTVAAFFRKYPETVRRHRARIRICKVTNVGFDTTGRRRDGNHLPVVAEKLANPYKPGDPRVTTYDDVPANETLQRAATYLFGQSGRQQGRSFRDFVNLANTGRTPGRRDYTENGMFILKVGNLTGRGIDWTPRERNFVSKSEETKRVNSPKHLVCAGDILLTSSAHAARYIAKKVDVVVHIPSNYSEVTFVGELIRVRPKEGVDPFVLLASLRHPHVMEDLQARVRGQTAHLHPNDLLEVIAPCDLFVPTSQVAKSARLMRREAELAFELYSTSSKAISILRSPISAAI